MKRVVILIVIIGTSCLSLSAQNANKAVVAGSWKGSFADSLGSGTLSVTFNQETSGDVSGTYETSSGGSGTVTGDIHSDDLEFILTQKNPNCVGSYTGKLTVSGSSASGTYWGDDCNGKHSNGVISLMLKSSAAISTIQTSKSPGTSTGEYVPCMAPSIFLFKNPDSSKWVERLKEGSSVAVLGREGDWFKVKAQSGKVGYIKKDWMCQKAEYEARMSNSPSGSVANNSTTTQK